jgi:hypothetical protein
VAAHADRCRSRLHISDEQVSVRIIWIHQHRDKTDRGEKIVQEAQPPPNSEVK